MSVVQDIRRLRMEGESIASIARNPGVSEPTVRKYLRPRDMSPSLPVKEKRPSAMDRYAGIVDDWLEEDQGNWHKQRHTAKRIWQRLVFRQVEVDRWDCGGNPGPFLSYAVWSG